LVYTISSSDNWLSAEPSCGTCTTETDTITITVDRTGLPTGGYDGTITIDAGAGGTQQISVHMTVPDTTEQVWIALGDAWRYFKGFTAPPAGWNTLAFDDAAWPAGPTGIGYSDDISYPTTLNDMPGNYVTFCARRQFQVADPSAVLGLALGVVYDDGFVAYINGVEVARSASMGPAGSPVAYDDPAQFPHDEIEPTPGLLQAGPNVLAIELHNVYISSSDAGLVPRLVALISNRVPGDTDADGDVDIFDVIAVINAFGSASGDPNWDPRCDFDGNGTVDVFDVIAVVDNFGTGG